MSEATLNHGKIKGLNKLDEVIELMEKSNQKGLGFNFLKDMKESLLLFSEAGREELEELFYNLNQKTLSLISDIEGAKETSEKFSNKVQKQSMQWIKNVSSVAEETSLKLKEGNIAAATNFLLAKATYQPAVIFGMLTLAFKEWKNGLKNYQQKVSSTFPKTPL